MALCLAAFTALTIIQLNKVCL